MGWIGVFLAVYLGWTHVAGVAVRAGFDDRMLWFAVIGNTGGQVAGCAAVVAATVLRFVQRPDAARLIVATTVSWLPAVLLPLAAEDLARAVLSFAVAVILLLLATAAPIRVGAGPGQRASAM